MIIQTIYFLGLIILGFLVSLPIFIYIVKHKSQNYSLKNDPWIYMWLLGYAMASVAYFMLPDFKDSIVSLGYSYIAVPFILAAVLYVLFLLELNALFYIGMVVSSAVVAYMIPSDVLIFENKVPFIADRLIVFASILSVTFFAKILNGMSAVFGIFVLTGLLGTTFVSALGGAPLLFGCIAVLIAGVWIGFLRYNWYPSEIALTDGACSSAAFLLACFFLYNSFEMAGSSMLILLAYLVAEILWVIVRCYIFRNKEPEFYNNTAYFLSYTRDISVDAILVAVSKIAVINLIFACFQIYSPNAFSVPLFTLIVDLWLLNMLYRASEPDLSLKETNEEFINGIKDGFKTIAGSFKKGK